MIFFLLIWAINTLGFFALASCMAKHQKQFFQHEPGTRQRLWATSIGWLLLITALSLCFLPDPPSNAISYWFGTLTFAGLFVGLCLSYRADQIKTIVFIIAILAICGAIGYLI